MTDLEAMNRKWIEYCRMWDSRVSLEDIPRLLAVVVKDEREACAKLAEQKAEEFRSPQYATEQPLSSFSERFACTQVAEAIRERNNKQ
jgi:hypothetical protein